VAGGGDLNHDGYADVVVGAQGFDTSVRDAGAMFAYLGGAGGLSPAPAWMAISDRLDAGLGHSVAIVGDVNGDGFDDVAGGAWRYPLGGYPDVGRVYLFLGPGSGPVAAPDCILTGPLDDDGGGAHFGSAVAPAGDVNADGFDEFLVGAPYWEIHAVRHGVAYLYTFDRTTPAQVSLVSADATPQRIRLTWHAAEWPQAAIRVYRRDQETNWGRVGELTPDGTGLAVYEDRAVAPGNRYGYRLGLESGGRETFAGETWVEVPALPTLRLAGAQPNPAHGALTISFSLPDGSPARLEVFDLAGRRVFASEVGGLGAGAHSLRIGEAGVLRPGLYLIRLVREGVQLSARAVVAS
jgi:hypothetical protein